MMKIVDKETPYKHSEVRSFSLLDTRFHEYTIDTLMMLVKKAVEDRRRTIIAHHNLHSLALVQKDPIMADFYRIADAIHIDGMALVIIGRALGYRLARKNRITYLDWMPHLMSASTRHRWRICYVGSKPGIGDAAAQVLRRRFDGLSIVTHHGYFDVTKASDNLEVLDFVDRCSPDIVMVGMGMPRQERWIVENLADLPNVVILTCGAALDYAAGIVPTPPRWTGQLGVEWLYRLMAEPKRMWYRYLVEPCSLALPLARELRRRRSERLVSWTGTE